MIHFTPTLGIKDTAKNANDFVKDNKSEFWHLMKIIAPYLAIALFAMIYIQYQALEIITETAEAAQIEIQKVNPDDVSLSKEEQQQKFKVISDNIAESLEEQGNSLFNLKTITYLGYAIQLILSYLFAVIAVSWHRLVILGAQHYKPMMIFKPQTHEIHFMLLVGLTSFLMPVLYSYLQQKALTINPTFGLLGLVGGILYIYILFKISFLFPSRAINSDISVKDSFYLTKGYFWKFGLASLLACLKTVLVMFLVFFVLSITLMPLFASTAENIAGIPAAMILISIPMYFYFTPLLTVIFVTVLSNYYQHALKNKSVE